MYIIRKFSTMPFQLHHKHCRLFSLAALAHARCAAFVRGDVLRRVLTAWIVLALGCSAIDASAGYNVWTSDYTFTRSELQAGVASRFPRDVRYGELFVVRLSNPQLSLDPANNRIVTRIDARVSSQLFGGPPVDGVLSVSSGLKYDSAARAVRLDRPVVERVDVAGMPQQSANQMSAIGNLVAQQVLTDYALYTFTPEQLQLNGQRFEPGAISITGTGIKVEIRQL